MSTQKISKPFLTDFLFEKEEAWLNQMAAQGWNLARPGTLRCEPSRRESRGVGVSDPGAASGREEDQKSRLLRVYALGRGGARVRAGPARLLSQAV